MRPLATLEADLWLAQRANRRNPSEENQALVDSIEAEIAALSEPLPTADTAKVADAHTKPEESAENPSNTAENADAQAQSPTVNAVETKPKKETKPKAPAKKKEEELK